MLYKALAVASAVAVRGSFLDRGHIDQISVNIEGNDVASGRRRRSQPSGKYDDGNHTQDTPPSNESHSPIVHQWGQVDGGRDSGLFDFDEAKRLGETGEEFRLNLWQGRDYPMDHFSVNELKQEGKRRSERNVQMFGLPNSGTSLFRAMLFANFGTRLTHFDSEVAPGPPKPGMPNLKNGIYRGSNFKLLANSRRDVLKRVLNQDMYTIFVIRNPYSWLRAMKTDPRVAVTGMATCVEDDDWLTKRCLHDNPVGPNTGVSHVTFNSLPDIWNVWTAGYLSTAEMGFEKRYVVTYENFVGAPDKVMSSIANFLGIEPPPQFIIPYRSPQQDQAVKSTRTGGYMSQLSVKEKYESCHRLDPERMSMFKYPTFQCGGFAAAWTRAHPDDPVYATAQEKEQAGSRGLAWADHNDEAEKEEQGKDGQAKGGDAGPGPNAAQDPLSTFDAAFFSGGGEN